MAIGGVCTAGTLACMIFDLRKKSAKIDTVQKVQSHQLELIYEPDIRLASWTDISSLDSVIQSEIVLTNHGEDVKIINILEKSRRCILNVESMKEWFPYDFDKGEDFHIPLISCKKHLSHNITIICLNRLGQTYLFDIYISGGKPIIKKPVKQ